MSFQLDNFKKSINTIQSKKTKLIELPDIHGKLNRFSVTETSYLSPKLAAKFPSIKSYTAKGIDTPTLSAKISIGTDGFHATIFNPSTQTLIIEPYTKDQKEYIIHEKSDLKSTKNNFKCEVNETIPQFNNITSASIKNVNDGNLRTYRLALACTGEYSQFHLNQQGVPTSASETTKKAAVLSAINTTMTRVNSVFENDLAVRMILVDNNDQLIFLDATTDDLDNSDPNFLINQSQTKCDDIIGTNNYDIGHTFSTAAGGLAELRSVCNPNNKANGITGRSQPIGDTFDIDYVAHEIGHQFGATHTFNNSCNGNRTNSTAIEPGSGSTIMGYAGICSPNVQNVSDVYFHSVSIAQMWNHVTSNSDCSTLSNTNNTAPTVTINNDVFIPKSTPFILKGQAEDTENPNNLTFAWEQIDSQIATMAPLATNTSGPMFRSITPTNSPNRYFPELATVVNGNTSTTWEVLPSVARELNFALLVRDNHPEGGASAQKNVKITVTNASPFIITSPSSNTSWAIGSTQTITWNKGTTDQAPINCEKVTIKLSIDGGFTFPIILKQDIANDGSENIIVPNNITDNARIMVEAADNIFYNMNTSDIVIFPANPDFEIENTTGHLSVCNQSTDTITYNFNYSALYGFDETVNLSISNTPTNVSGNFNTLTLNSDRTFSVSLHNLKASNSGDYSIRITATSDSKTKSFDFPLNISSTICKSSGNNNSEISITNVTFNTIDNTSTKTNGYSNFTSLKTPVVKGEPYDLSTTINADGTAVNTFAWIDWNQNCVFETDEMYDLSSGNMNIIIPENATLGETTLRISAIASSNPNSCKLNMNGEVEDYTITVDDVFATNKNLFSDISMYPIPSDGKLTVNFKVKDKNSTIIKLYDLRGRLLDTQYFSTISSSFNNEITFNKVSSGVYLVQIQNAGKTSTKKIIIK